MATQHRSSFETPLGEFCVVWTERGIAGVQLPEADARATRARLSSRFPEAVEAPPPPKVKRAIDDICALLRGEDSALGAVALDLSGVSDFRRRVYEAAREIPPGRTRSYGEIARSLGPGVSPRAVGQALGANPFAVVVPCHRVVAAGGKPGGFSAAGGTETKLRLLEIEGAAPREHPPLFGAEPKCGFDAGAALEQLRAADAALGRVIDRVGAFRMEQKARASVLVALSEAIVYQQLHAKAAATIFARVCALFPRSRGHFTPEQILALPDVALRGVGLSQAKLRALRDLAERVASGSLPTLAKLRALDDGAVIEKLTAVRGIGPWTAQMFLMFRLGRPDVLPADDYGIRQGFAVAFRRRALPTPAEVLRRGERWKPWRSVASWYLWRAAEFAQRGD